MSQADTADEADLVRRSRGGDREAFAELVRRYQHAAWAAARGRVADPAEAMDIVQDAFVAAYCRLGQLRDARRFGPWLRRIVQNRAAEWARRHAARGVFLSALPDSDGRLAAASARRHQRRRRRDDLHEAVAALPARYREVVLLQYLQRWPRRRIAWFTGLPVSTIKGRLQVARRKLRQLLAGEPATTEGIAMKPTPIEKNVEAAVCQIAAEPIHETIPLGGARNVVLFCGVRADVELCQSGGDQIVLTGTRASIGHDAPDARRSLEGLRVQWDRVADWAASGPHAMQVYCGTRRAPRDGSRAYVLDAADAWQVIWPAITGRQTYRDLERLYPQLAPALGQEQADGVRHRLQNAVRVSVGRERMEDIALPAAALTESVRRVFAPNCLAGGEAHGPRGYVSLTVGVPRGVGVTCLCHFGMRVHGEQLRSNLTICGGNEVVLSDVEGDLCLWETSVRTAERIRGRYLQTSTRLGGTEWDEGPARRIPLCPRTRLDRIDGEVHLDLLKANLDAAGLHWRVTIRNRLGATRLQLTEHRDGDRHRIEADSGGVLVLLHEDLRGAISVTVNSLCGRLASEGLGNVSELRARNDLQVMTLSTVREPEAPNLTPQILDADLYIRTCDGDVTIEATR
jgi:RNA polymerase sigma-70 factor (ECF subfamily)